MVEQLICNQPVGGSSPFASFPFAGFRRTKAFATLASDPARTKLIEDRDRDSLNDRGFGGEVPKRPKGTDCKSVGSAFRGSNPLLPTMHARRGDPSGALVRSGKKQDRTTKSIAGIAQWLERQPSKLRVAGSNPVSRSSVSYECKQAHVAQSVEHLHGKQKVTSSILVVGSRSTSPAAGTENGVGEIGIRHTL